VILPTDFYQVFLVDADLVSLGERKNFLSLLAGALPVSTVFGRYPGIPGIKG